jgi:hypothetical protein
LKKKIIIISIFFLVIFSFPVYSQRTDSDLTDQAELETILKKCAEYCEKLANVVLFFVCQEEIKEEIYNLTQADSVVVLGPDQEKVNQLDRVLFRGQKAEKNVYVYDYQLIRKENKINENRILIEENGQKKHEKNAQLKTKLFRHKNIIFGPIGLLSRYWQPYHDYKIIKEEKIKGEKAIVIEAVAKPSFKLDHLSGKVWIRKNDFSILKIEWNQESIKNYEQIEEFANKFKLKPRIKLVSEYGFEKNGIRFPNRYFIEEAYSGRISNNIIRSKKNVIYKDYKFFTVETKVKYGDI